MKEKTCLVFGAGEHVGYPPSTNLGDFVIAADGGYDYAVSCGIAVDLLIGDFDSLQLMPSLDNVVKLPTVKDDTDMIAAINAGWKQGYRQFHIYGGTGGRIEHTLANIQSIADIAKRGGRAYLYDKESVITVIHNSQIDFEANMAGFVSVFAFGDVAECVSETGLKYTLSDATLQNTYPMGVSNEFIGETSCISVRNGTLLIVFPRIKKETLG
jgi:thiamine pyrophosphokinase